MTRDLLIIIPFGQPHLDNKWRILRSNIAVIRQGCPDVWTRVIFKLAVYNEDLSIPDDIESDKDIHIVRQKSIVGDFFRDHASPDTIINEGFDYVMLLLDDVEIRTQPSWEKLLVMKELSGAHLLTPTLASDSATLVYPYMSHMINAPHTARMMTIMEMFCFLFDSKSYIERYYPLLDKDNPWMWGIDLCLFYDKGVRSLQVNTWIATHHYRGTGYNGNGRDPEADMQTYLTKKGFSVQDLAKDAFVISILHMEHLKPEQWNVLWKSMY